MKTPLPKVKCLTCCGTGEIELPESLCDTMEILKKLGKATSFDIHKHKDFKDHVVETAVTNRLARLYRLGLLTRIRDGKAWLYSAK